MKQLSIPNRETLTEICREACKGTSIDPDRLAYFLASEGDPEWMKPEAVKRWALIVQGMGWDAVGNPRPEAAPTGKNSTLATN